MAKLILSKNGRTNDGNYDIDVEQTAPPHLTVSRGNEILNLTFATFDEQKLYSQGVALCRCFDENGNRVYVTSLSKK